MIEAVGSHNLDEVIPLVRAYLEFYEVADIDDGRNRHFFARFHEDSEAGCQFLYRNDSGRAVAFATVYFTYLTSLAAKVGVMNDLFTLESERGQGIGRRLIEHCHAHVRRRGGARLQWLTAPDNLAARKLYDSLNARQSQWLVYAYTGE